jgi:hypothetical protein
MATQNLSAQEAPARQCVHHWIIEPAGGPTSGGRCRHCGEERYFINDPDAVTDPEYRSGFGHGVRRGAAWRHSA